MTVWGAFAVGCGETVGACGRWIGRILLLALLAAGLVVITAARGPVPLPAPLATLVSDRVSAIAPEAGVRAEIGALAVALRGGLRPVIVMAGLQLRDAGGVRLLAVDRLEAVLSRRALSEGRLAPSALRAEGLTLRLRRDAEGQVALLGAADRPLLDAQPNPAALIDRLQAALATPPLAPLRRIHLSDVTMALDDAQRGRRLRSREGSLHVTTGPDRPFTLEVDLGRMAGTGDGVGRLRGTLEVPRAGGATAGLVARGLVPAAVAGVAGVGPLADLLARLDAPMSLDLNGTLDGAGLLEGVSGTIAVGAGGLAVAPARPPVPIRSAAAQVELGPRANILRLTDLRLEAPGLTLAGQLAMRADPGGLDGPIVAQAALHDVVAALPALQPDPLDLDALWVTARYDRRGEEVEIAALTAEIEGARITGSGRLDLDAAAPLQAALDLRTDALSPQTLLALWPPDRLRGTRRWIDGRVEAGRFRAVTASVRVPRAGPPEIGLSFGFSDAVVRPLDPLPPLEAGRGAGGIDGDVFALAVAEARMLPPGGAPVALEGGRVRVPDLRSEERLLEVAFDARGTAADAAALARMTAPRPEGAPVPDPPPGLARGTLTGEAAVSARLSIPLRKGIRFPDIGFSMEGTLRDVASDALVQNRSVEAESLRLAVAPEGLEIAGPARIDGHPIDIRARRPLRGPAAGVPPTLTVEASGPLTPALARSFVPALPAGTLSGAGRLDLTVAVSPGDPPALDLQADLGGLGVAIPALGIGKGEGANGSLALAGRLGPGARFDPVRLRLPGARADGTLALGPGGAEVVLRRIALGDWLDAAGRIAPGGAVALTGGSLDLRRIPRPGGTGGGAVPARIDLALDRVVVTDRIALTDLEGRLDGGLSGRLAGRVNGGAPIALRLVQQGGGVALHGTAEDGGAVLRDAGLYGGLRGGALDVRLVPAGGPGAWRGRAHLTDTAVGEAPMLARVVSGASLVGLAEQASGDGITFSDVTADFRLAPGGMAIDAASAVGPSIGLSLDGRVDFASRRLDLQGVVSPIYFLNRAGAFMTRRGEGLIGLSYTVTGPIAAPRVAVNPLSVLTPGFLREIFRRDRARLPGDG